MDALAYKSPYMMSAFSTVEARAHLFEQGGYRSLDKGSVDATSAVIILESWFERQY
ncbi:holliday junction resolvase [Proteus mirabilis]|uniref:Holliday junction resolvase n=1 Tax=Proteus mirabilis TaxID=584 RepID=A0A379FHY7_PROMI|nr:holliday junction resolvase [Proteus mirabilis]